MASGSPANPIGADLTEVVPVLELFRREGRSFLMPPASAALDADSLVDISHESLIRNWARLKEWVDEEAQSALVAVAAEADVG